MLFYLQAFILSNGDGLTGRYRVLQVRNILKSSLRAIIESEAYNCTMLHMAAIRSPDLWMTGTAAQRCCVEEQHNATS